jgi:hypothetical protein
LVAIGLFTLQGTTLAQPPSIDGQIADQEYRFHYVAEPLGIALHWTIEGEYLYVGLTAPTLGWVAVGWGSTGAIKEGADILLGYLRDGELYLQDFFANSSVSHLSDVSLGGRDDILESSGSETVQRTTIEFRRRLNTEDRFDRPLAPGVQTVLLAYSSADDFITYHGERRVVTQIDFFAGAAQKAGLYEPPGDVGVSGLLRDWGLTLLTGVLMTIGLGVAFFLWPRDVTNDAEMETSCK